MMVFAIAAFSSTAVAAVKLCDRSAILDMLREMEGAPSIQVTNVVVVELDLLGNIEESHGELRRVCEENGLAQPLVHIGIRHMISLPLYQAPCAPVSNPRPPSATLNTEASR
jgi:hypothetical protein